MNTVTVQFEQLWPEDCLTELELGNLDLVREIWQSAPEIAWLIDQGYLPTSQHSSPVDDLGFDSEWTPDFSRSGFDSQDFAEPGWIYTLVFDIPETVRTVMLLKFPEQRRRIDID